MANKHLSLQPEDIAHRTERAWWYEEPRGINVVIEIKDGDRYLRTAQLKIPWAKVRAALARKDRRP
jgi:hypothetical protein